MRTEPAYGGWWTRRLRPLGNRVREHRAAYARRRPPTPHRRECGCVPAARSSRDSDRRPDGRAAETQTTLAAHTAVTEARGGRFNRPTGRAALGWRPTQGRSRLASEPGLRVAEAA